MIGNALEVIEWLYSQEKDKIFEIKEYKPKRSLTQNAYAWKLITLIANKVFMDKEEVYRDMLKHYGQSDVISILSEVNPKGYFKYYEKIGTGYVNGKEFTHYRIYKGSSEYDINEMRILMEGIIHEAEQLGIPTLEEDEIGRMRIV